MSRYFVEWSSQRKLDHLKREAILRGTYSADHDDWYEPPDIVVYADAGNNLAQAKRRARALANSDDAVYGQATLHERFPDPDCPLLEDSREIATFEARS